MENGKKNVNYTNNDGAKYRYSASQKKEPAKDKKPNEALTKRAILWKTNKALAIAILVVVVILSSVWSIHRAISRRASVVEEYYTGTDAGDANVRKNIKEFRDNAFKLYSLGALERPEGEEVANLKALIDELDREIDSPFWKNGDLVKDIHDAASFVCNSVGASSNNAERLYEDVDTSYMKLHRDLTENYNAAAREYNKVIKTFPVSIFGRKTAPVFD